jgi:plasmid stability protein
VYLGLHSPFRHPVIAFSIDAIIFPMKQLLLRVPEDVHRRLAARAAREGKSVNSVATGILDAAVDADQGNRKQRLVAKMSAAGTLSSAPAAKISRSRRRRILESTRGLGRIADRLIATERDRL